MGAALTTDEIVISLLGVLALSQAAFTGVRYATRDQHPVPTPELRDGIRSPGESFDRDLQQLDSGVRERLRSATVAVLSRFDSAPPQEAEKLLEEGTWTDDRLASAFFSSEISGTWLRRPPWLGGRPLVVEQAVSTIDVLSGLVGDRLPRAPNVTDHAKRSESKPQFASSDSLIVPANETSDRWRGLEAVTLCTLALGAVRTSASLLLMGGVGVALVGYAAYGRVGSTTEVDVTVERTLEPDSPRPGEEVTVSVTVRNEGERTLPDLRIFDGVPSELDVIEGSARHVAILRPGQTTEFSYTLEAEHGDHPFDPAFVLAGDVTGERWQTAQATNDGTHLLCHLPSRPNGETVIRKYVSKYAGQITSNQGGSGVQFHETREYQRGDPMSLIDWKSLARTGELTALEFSEERIVEVMIAVDARSEANVAPDPSERSAVARSAEAADRLMTALLAENNRVGVTMIGSGHRTLELGRGSDHELAARQLLADYPTVLRKTASNSTIAPDVSRLRRYLSKRTQVVLLSPLCDDSPVNLARHLEAAGVRVLILSPNPTTTATPGETLASIERLVRLDTLHRAGVPVYEWRTDESLPTAIQRGQQMRQAQ